MPDLVGRPALIGREDELTRLGDIAEHAVEHGTQMLLASGEAGIGKTTLITECFTTLSEAGWGTHVGHCIEFADRPLPFGPIVAILRSILLDNLDDADELIGRHRDDLAGLLPELAGSAPAGASLAGDVDRLFDGIAHVLSEAANRRPIAVLVEDIHWADAATRDLITSLIHTLGPARILLVITERTGAVDRKHPVRTWMAERRRHRNVHSLALEGLGQEELAQQALAVLGEAPSAAELDELAARTRGNPYFAQELLVARAAGNHELPTSLADFVGSRIERLDDDQRHVLRALAVAGGGVGHRMLTAMTPDLKIEPVIRTLYDGGIIAVDGSDYSFGHALLREAILRDVLPFELESFHRLAAEAIELDPHRGVSVSDLVSLALHWGKASDADRSLSASAVAAHAAAAIAAYETAAEMALQAIWSWPAATDAEHATAMTRDQLLLQAAEWLSGCYRGEEAISLIDEALASWGRDLTDAKRALLLASIARTHYHLGNPTVASNLVLEAQRLVGEEASPEASQVHFLVSRQALADTQIRPARAAADRAIAIAEQEGPKVVLVGAMLTKALAIGVIEDPGPGIELAREARAIALAEGFVAQVALSYRTEMLILNFQSGRTESCLDATRHGLAYAEQHCGPRWRAEFKLDLCLGYVEAGRLNQAQPLIEDLLDSELDDLRRMSVLQVSGLHALTSGALNTAESYLLTATDIADRYESAQETGYHFRLMAELARRKGDFDAASAHIDRALDLQLAGDNLTLTRESIVEKLRIVRAQVGLGRKQAIDTGELEELVKGFDGSTEANRAMHSLMKVELGSLRGALDREHARVALGQLQLAGFFYEAVQVRLLIIDDLLAESPSHNALSEQITEVWTVATTHGMSWVADRAESLARAARITLDAVQSRPMTKADAYPNDLTAREVEVMSLLAEGLTNKGIGERLYVSPRTVGTHVSNLLAKLGLGNRGEAAAAFHRLGLAETVDLRDPAEAEHT